ncbi:MAG: hypothetical protein A2Y33_08585 [Spirochaetes bacterium GWF1_51_8]|nr:MAG: hypothetical protein A2Y33_08585 [Spirochaetes bacterium GWF1_51_8]
MRRISALVLSLFFVSCGIEAINSVVDLNAPLGLTAGLTNIIVIAGSSTNTNSVIRLEFWGFNDETYFDGYQLYAADSLSDLNDAANSYRAIPSQDGTTNTLTIYGLAAMTEAKKYTIYLSKDTNYVPLVNLKNYYFNVRAYGFHLTESVYSKPGNPVSIQYQD